MRLVGLLVSLAILGYVISIYLDSSGADEEAQRTRPQQTVEQAEDVAKQLNESLQKQQEHLRQAD